MKIQVIIHFLDSNAISRIFSTETAYRGTAKNIPKETSAYDLMWIWLNSTNFFEFPNGVILPASQIAKVTWKEVPAE